MTEYLDSSRLNGRQTYAATGTQTQTADAQTQTTDSVQSQSTAASIYDKNQPVTETATSSTISFEDFKASYNHSSIDSNGVRVGVRAAVVAGFLIGADYLFCKGKHVKGLFNIFKKTKIPNASSAKISQSVESAVATTLPATISRSAESVATAAATSSAKAGTATATTTLPSVCSRSEYRTKAFEQALNTAAQAPKMSNIEFISSIHSKISESAFKNLTTDEIDKLAKMIGCKPEEVTHMSKGLYKKLALKWHPDRNQNNPIAHDLFQLLGNLYDIAKKG